MFAEFVRHLTTTCFAPWKEMGYARRQIALEFRHRRCKAAWAPHLRACMELIDGAAAATDPAGKAVVLGSGPLLDVPLESLAERFDEVLLIDVVHPPASRRLAAGYDNVGFALADLSGVADALYLIGPDDPLPEPEIDEVLLSGADLVVSANLLSQLPLVPLDWLERRRPGLDEAARLSFARTIVDHHLALLQRQPGRVVLITEVMRRLHDGDRTLDKIDSLFGAQLAYQGAEWTWQMAPRPEIDRGFDLSLRILGIDDLAAAAHRRRCRNTTLAAP